MDATPMEMNIVYVILAGWALMLFLPSIFLALLLSAGFGGAVAYMVHLGHGGDGDLVAQMMVIAPIAAVAVFLAWPVGALFRWVLRRRSFGH